MKSNEKKEGEETWKTDFTNARTIALSAGDLNVAIRTTIDRILSQNDNKILASVKEGLKELSSLGYVTENEVKTLNSTFIVLMQGKEKKGDPEEAFFKIRKDYYELVQDHNSSPVALAIMSVANSSFEYKKSNSISVSWSPGSAGAGAIAGGLLGAGIGLATGIPGGPALGAAIGAIAGAAVGLCNEKGV